MTKYALEEYEEQALDRWKKHFYECPGRGEDWPDYDEWCRAHDSWLEAKQVRFINYNMTLKVKWEHRCWWPNCPSPRNFHGSYSCILIDIKDGEWQEPYDHAKKGGR